MSFRSHHSHHHAVEAPDPQWTPEQTAEYRAYREARRKVKALRAWYLHALIYVLVVSAFWLRYWLVMQGIWPSWRDPHMPLGMTFGWGIGLLAHGIFTIVRWNGLGPWAREWEERAIQKQLQQKV
jgi:hypothetical protein